MLHGNLGKIILVAIICAAVFYLIIPLDLMLKEEPRSLAFIPHEDPETAEQVLSSTSLFRYYFASLEFALNKTPEEVEARLEKIPFANIPQSLEQVIGDFASSAISISYLVVDIDKDLSKLRALREQFRLDEATEQAGQISAKLSQTNSELKRIEQVIETTGEELKMSSAPEEGSDLRRSYDEVLEGTDRIREMPDLYQDILTDLLRAPKLLSLTEVTLEIEPMVVFIGDNIRFEGTLTSEGKPLAGREVDILINSSRYVTVKTDAYGHYQGTLQVPYWYIPKLGLQALYYPQDRDIGVYLASLSPVIKLQVLFYEAVLDIAVEDRAYPGLEATVTGRFDYGQSPSLSERKAEIYFDDVLITEAVAQEAFAQEIKIDPEVDVGEHIVTVSSAAVGRYSSVVSSIILNVTKATPILDISIPKVAMIPGSIGIEGKLYSEVGPLSEASIKMGLGKSQVELVSSEDGVFDTKIKVGMGFGMVGSQDLEIEVIPQEPWHAPLNATSRVLMVNMINGGGILVLLIFLGIFLPGRLRRRLGTYPRRTVRPAIATAAPEPAPTYSERVAVLTSTEKSDEASGEPRNRIFYWYRLVVRLLRGITKAFLGPQQTLREFARESSRVLGPAAKYFIELTKMVERLLYSQYRPTEKDVENSKQLSDKIEGETKLRVTMQPRLAWQFRGEGTGAQFELNELSIVGGAREVEFGGRVLTTSPWRQLSTWLWVLMILAVAYYACILLFVLPLLVASLAPCLPLVIVGDLRERETRAVTKEELKGEGV